MRCYPDTTVCCGAIVPDEEDDSSETITNPTALFEVLSKSTEAYDRGFKAENYRQIDSLRVYVLVAQDAPHAELYERQTDGSWLLREVRGLNAALSVGARCRAAAGGDLRPR